MGQHLFPLSLFPAFIDDKGFYRIPFERLQLLSQSDEVKRLLSDEHVLESLKKIESAGRSTAWVLDKAIREVRFLTPSSHCFILLLSFQ